MKRILLLAMCVLFLNIYGYAQTFEGTIKDAKTNEALAYVNVGIIGKANGTVTDDNGHFKLTLTNNNADSLRISMIGYAPATFLVKDFAAKYIANEIITLTPALYQLGEVKIYIKKFKQSILGNTTTSQSTDAGFTSNLLGNEIGEVIKIKRSPTVLKQFNASLAHEATDSAKLRLNFYSIKDGMPDKILLQKNIFVTVKKGQNKITVDLSPYNIIVKDKFFVSLESIQSSRGTGLMLSASFFSSPIIARETSQSNWEKIGFAGIGFNVLASY